MDFMVVDAPPGEHDIRLQFVTPLENRVGRGVTALTLALLLSLMVFVRRWEPWV
jgi:Mrp family chromosome partitioning ATPase